MILLDTGPLVALFDPQDMDHKKCHKVLKDITEPLYTTEAVVTEVLHMLEPGSRAVEGVKTFLLEQYVNLLSLDAQMLQRCFELLDKYSDLPMDFADATLITLAEKYKTEKVFTLDISDFEVYRFRKGHRVYPLSLIGLELLKQK